MNRSVIVYAVALLTGAFALNVIPLRSQEPLRLQQKRAESNSPDSDHDGISDSVEQFLLAKFSPTFFLSQSDCSVRPAQFVPDAKLPTVLSDDGTIYGQAFPRAGHPGEVELHYYHLWRKDCGEMGHPLDTEHVSALVKVETNLDESKALFWYAAAHEDTVCDASQITRADTVHAGQKGATVWISAGKHASFLSPVLCTHGCGGDRCEQMERLKTRQIVNLGEAGAAMNNIAWLASPEWPLRDKMERTDFPEARVARLRTLQAADIAWANPSKRPAQAVILGANAGIGSAATGARSADTALVVANAHTSSALDEAAGKTGHALKRSTHSVLHALKMSAQTPGKILDSPPK
jgi:hypothetical protein